MIGLVDDPAEWREDYKGKATSPDAQVRPPAGDDVSIVLVRPNASDFANGVIDAVNEACVIGIHTELVGDDPVDNFLEGRVLGVAIAATNFDPHFAVTE